MLALTVAQAKNFSEPLYFYRPFGDSSVISSSILNANGYLLPLLCVGLWLELERRVSQKHVLWHIQKKVNKAHIVLFCKYLHSHVFFQKTKKRTVTELFLSWLELWVCQNYLQHTKAQSMLGSQIAYTVGHGAPGTFELMNYHLFYVQCHCRSIWLDKDEFSSSDFFLTQI